MRSQREKGITLIELIIVMALITIVLGIVYNIFFVSTKTFDTGVTKAAAQQEARLIAHEISNQLKYASRVSTSRTDENYRLRLNNQKLIIEKYSGAEFVEEKSYGSNIREVTFYTDPSPSTVLNYDIIISDGEDDILSLASSVQVNNAEAPFSIGDTSEVYFSKE